MLCQSFVILSQKFIFGLFLTGLGLTGLAWTRPFQDSNPILQYSDSIRLRHLYTASESRHLHLQINSDGQVGGTTKQSPYSLLEMKAVKTGFVVIRGKKSARYLCMERSGRLYGSLQYTEKDCTFKEVVLADGYNLYVSEEHQATVTLSPMRARIAQGKKIPPFSHFLPMVNKVPVEDVAAEMEFVQVLREMTADVDSPDPFGMTWEESVHSPSFFA
uniref:Fibroblast growth factor n=1 Tax=Latimeria chalumnae TaxID=7897 RepID=H3A2B0_LATCH